MTTTINHSIFIAAVILVASSVVATAIPGNSSDFIRISCAATQYPRICYRSLAGYANAVQENPHRLAVVAIHVSFSRAKHMSSHLASLSPHAGSYNTDLNRRFKPDPEAAAAVEDCLSMYGDAVDQILGSLNQMRKLSGAGEELSFQISNVQTWMSAALTNEDTCYDGFDDVADGPVKFDVSRRTTKVMAVTSNALSLVNKLV